MSFGPSAGSGGSPRGQLLEASDGWLYGTTSGGGSNGYGTVFTLSKTSNSSTVLHSFNDGYSPCGGVVEAKDGSLCGTTSRGVSYSGTVFKLNKDGRGYTLLHLFPAFSGDGAQPMASLTAGKGGVLYGTTLGGGATGNGTAFSLTPDGSNYTVLHSFAGATGGFDGSSPGAGLCQGLDGALYGTTQAGGSNDLGTIFKLNADGTGYAVLHHFSGGTVDGRLPYSGLIQGNDGLLYGTTYYGGTNDLGTVFRLGTNGGAYSVLMSFAGGTRGDQPFAGLVQATNGLLYGTTRYGGSNDGGTVFKLSTDGSGFGILHSFTGINGEGSQPLAALLVGSDGALYGSTFWGGAYATNGVTGTLFKMFDSGPPIMITVLGANPLTNQYRTPYVDPGATAWAPGFGLASFTTNSTVNTNVVGLYRVQYVATDLVGNSATNTRMVIVQQPAPPIILGETFAGKQFQVSFSGPDGQPYSVLATTNLLLPLSSWAVLTNGTFAGPASFIDTATASNRARFYKIRSP